MNMSAIEDLLARCRSEDRARQVSAIHALSDRNVVQAVPTLVDVLRSEDPTVRSVAAEALGVLGGGAPELAGPALLQALNDDDVLVRSAVADALGVMHYEPALPGLERVLRQDPEPLVRASAAESLGDLGNAIALGVLHEALDDPDDAVRAFAANSIGLLGNRDDIERLRGRAEADSSAEVRASLEAARYRLGEDTVDVLIALISTADTQTASAMLNLLRDLAARRSPRSLTTDAPRLRQALTDLGQRLAILAPEANEVAARLPSNASDQAARP
jgi:HEAT repeat protein